MVTQFREALDKQGSALTSTSLTKSARSPTRKTDEISATTSNKSFESFVRGIGKCSNLLDARRLRSDVTGQITKNKLLVGKLVVIVSVVHQNLT
jgi:sorting nexin-25